MRRQYDDLMLGNIELFCLAAELENFKEAALRAGLTPAAVSRSVSRLEAHMGVRLFERSTRKVRLTASGRAYYEQCRPALDLLGTAARELTGRQDEPSGRVRISMPTPWGHFLVLPLLPAFHERYPKVEIDVQLSNRNVDLIADGFDLAIRGRAPPDSRLVARKLMDAELVVVASPAYLAQAGVPRTPAELMLHQCIQLERPGTGQAMPWVFADAAADGAPELQLATRGAFRCSDDLLGSITLARAGAGIAQAYRFIVEEDLKRGSLLELLQPFGGRSRPFSLTYLRNPHMPARIRVLIDHLMASLSATALAPSASMSASARRMDDSVSTMN